MKKLGIIALSDNPTSEEMLNYLISLFKHRVESNNEVSEEYLRKMKELLTNYNDNAEFFENKVRLEFDDYYEAFKNQKIEKDTYMDVVDDLEMIKSMLFG